ncbi:uncharacterized protein LOC129585773 [Paramacrobiotus metropolitanus]|uniref:uncharacterized protein LOC129585773 n=1 Tax=Paramacrobiotus metropolitanus TaxID=2943436 RepID=UPI0024460E7B|nr:uncharacterized protein LOC129585773 [Paramacrobiotus metropolitanus]
MSSMAQAYRRLASGAGRASPRKRQPAPRQPRAPQPARGRRRRREERYDSSPDLSGSDDEATGRRRRKRPVRQRGAVLPPPAPPPAPLAAEESDAGSSDDDVDEGPNFANFIAQPANLLLNPIADNPTADGGAVPEAAAAAGPPLVQRNGEQNLDNNEQALNVNAPSVKVEIPRPAVQTRILQPTNIERPAQERIFAVDGKLEVRLNEPTLSVLEIPTAMKDPPFYRISTQLIGCHNISRDPTLTSRGVNRSVLLSFVCGPQEAMMNERACILLRFCAVPSERAAPDHHPPNLTVLLNETEIVKPKTINYGVIKRKPWYPPVEIAKTLLRTGSVHQSLTISWTVEGNTKSFPSTDQEFFVFVQTAERKTLDMVMQEIGNRRIPLGYGVAKVYNQMNDDDGDVAGDYRTVSFICPVSRQRISVPVRGKNCNHLECFDAQKFLELNSGTNAKFICPKCNSCIPPESLVVDGFTEEMLRFTPQQSLEIIAQNGNVKIREKPAVAPAITIDLNTQRDSIILLD